MNRKVLVAIALFVFATDNTACGPASADSQDQIELAALPAAVTNATQLPKPNNVPNERLKIEISEAQQFIRSRLPTGQVGDNLYAKLMSQVNRSHNWMLRQLISGEINMESAKALRAVYTILYRLATREFFVVIVPMDECQWLWKLGEIPVSCLPQQ